MSWIIEAEQSTSTNPLYWAEGGYWTANVEFAKKYDTYDAARDDAASFRFTNPKIVMP